MRYLFDIETNGFLDKATKVHSLVIKDLDSEHVYSYDYRDIERGLTLLSTADCLVGHNILDFDIPVINKLYPDITLTSNVLDTLITCRLIWADTKEKDFKLVHKGKMPASIVGSHSLEAWGYRLGVHKDTFGKTTDWEDWSPEMQAYCEQDVEVNYKLYKLIESKNYSEEAIQLEHDVRRIVKRQEEHGFLFDKDRAFELQRTLHVRQGLIHDKLVGIFKPFYTRVDSITPKIDNARYGYTAGAPLTLVRLTKFNPASRDHIINRLVKVYKWRPSKFTKKDKPIVNDETLSSLKFAEAKYIRDSLMLDKRLGQLVEGKEAWLKSVQTDGRIHGRVITNGAVTGRMTHIKPNMAQVPNASSEYGKECRALFTVPKGKKLVGIDASGLELRMLAHYLYTYDDGAYVDAVLNGDIHTTNQQSAGLATRDQAKTFIYAFIYGAGAEKIGSIAGKGARHGARLLENFLHKTPAISQLKKDVSKKVKQEGFVEGLDGRHIVIRSEHSALNFLLQGAGAVVMKKGLVILDSMLQKRHSGNYEFVANVHDEWQIECDEDIAEDIGHCGRLAIQIAGEALNVKCPLDGAYKVGNNWSETH